MICAGDTAEYLRLSKAQIVSNILRFYGTYAQGSVEQLFDRFFNYLVGVIHNGDTSQLRTEFYQV